MRELENVAQYVLHACRGEAVEPQHLPARLLQSLQADRPLTAEARVMSSAEWERQAIAEGLQRLGRTPRAKEILARQLGMSRSTIYRKIREYGLQ
ncbi:MAG: helix-turn-helix domain-containing protein [Bacillota bacterium]|nr:helix-turn-helix domain-containing protein [Bacillota bacterium]